MHTAKQMIPAVGSQVMVRFDSFGVPMWITDAKSAWGRVRLQVTPVDGEGSAWIECDRVIRVLNVGNVTCESAGRQIAMTEVK